MTATTLRPTGTPPERLTSRDPAAFGRPTGREELWRFTPTRGLSKFFDGLPGHLDANTISAEFPEQVTVKPITEDDPLWGIAGAPADRVSAVAWVLAEEATAISIPAGVQLDTPIVVHFTGHADRFGHDHLVIDAGSNSRATVILEHTGSGEHAANVEIRVGSDAYLDVVTTHNWGEDAIFIAQHDALLDRGAQFRHISITLGAGLVRATTTVRYAGPGGSAQLLGVALAGAHHYVESRSYVDHSQPDCSSDVLYKHAVLGDTARTVWVGDVRIRPAAVGTKTYELNRNLLLTDGARADSVPNLEIETGDIAGAGHASATGRFDDLQLFYLQSRGITAQEAQRLVVRGFFADIVNRIGITSLQDQVMTAIEDRLGFARTDTETDVENSEV